jgi:hypothetical protein
MKTWYYFWLIFGLGVAIASVIAGKYHPLIMASVCFLMAWVCKGAYKRDKVNKV